MQLWVHESSHYMLFRSRRLNDIWATIFFASPIGMSLATYRRYHMSHHRYLATPGDLDRFAFDVDVHGPRGLAGLIVRGLLCIDGLRLVLRKYVNRERTDAGQRDWSMLATIAWHGLLFTACVMSGRWYLYFVLWAYPILGVAVTINSLRTVGEHQPEGFDLPADAGQDIPPITRTTLPGPLEKWLMFQSNFNYHFEHHLYPTVPATNLPRLHRHLVEKGFYREHPDLLQSSGIARVFRLSRDRHADAPARPSL
jgi:fatty acid desaturase